MPFVSILIPTYRRLTLLNRFLPVCIEQARYFGNEVEIVVIDNCGEGSAKSTVKALCQDATTLRYVHEPRRGLATVRNSALCAAQGDYVIFLDDDQLPQEGWLRAFMDAAERGAKAAFGPLQPLFETPQASHYHAIAKRMFSRVIPAADGSDIGRLYPYLGTGNSLFQKDICFPNNDAFDVRFNLSGGEDVWMLKGLSARDIPFTWVANARVLEFVSSSRMNPNYLRSRRYHAGQLRTLLSLHPARRRLVGVLFWMGAGAAQVAFNMPLWWLYWFVWRDRAHSFGIKASGGLGKVMWFNSPCAAVSIKEIVANRKMEKAKLVRG